MFTRFGSGTRDHNTTKQSVIEFPGPEPPRTETGSRTRATRSPGRYEQRDCCGRLRGNSSMVIWFNNGLAMPFGDSFALFCNAWTNITSTRGFQRVLTRFYVQSFCLPSCGSELVYHTSVLSGFPVIFPKFGVGLR